MPLSQEFHISSRSFLQHVQVACVSGLIPVVLGVAFLLYLPAEKPHFVLWLMGVSASLTLVLAAGYQLCFEEEPGSNWGWRFRDSAPLVYPPAVVLTRQVFYAFSFLIMWRAAKVLGLKVNLWMDISFHLVLLLQPFTTFFKDLFEPGRRKGWVIVAAFVRMLKLNVNLSFFLSIVSTTTAADAIRRGEGLPVAVLILVPCGLVSVTSFILFIDLILRWEVHERRLRG